MCDGKWDCWNGEDEVGCGHYECFHLYKCRYTQTCIHIMNVCDGIIDCPAEDNEHLCTVKYCPNQCVYLNYGTTCQSAIFFQVELLLFGMSNFIYISISEGQIQIENTFDFPNTLIFICRKQYHTSFHLINLYMSFNIVTHLAVHDFNCLTSLLQLNLSKNKITLFKSSIFHSLSLLQVLDISENQITVLPDWAFCGLKRLHYLKF